ncbi:hypothetical protein GGR26_003151 [Lewinella marina]|nr:ferritin-like protein [Neolewinella marina]NJB87371.1 hypothetical protein [Neolewinella marina]
MIYLKEEVSNLPDQGLAGLKTALQTALELEHATIPPYLYALYSLQPGFNQRVVEMLRSVVLEEMLHMSLCCNLLNAIGGAPVLNAPDFLPVYPGPLPGAVAGVEVPLAPISNTLIKEVFMEIEEPENPLSLPLVPGPLTIGQFYGKIKRQLEQLSHGADIFTGDPGRQLTVGWSGNELIAVRDLNTALQAIETIVEQGEGTTTSPFDGTGELAHYYLFESIYKGYEYLPPTDPSRPADIGAPICLDRAGIRNLITNPTPTQYQGTPAEPLNLAFNRTYTELLEALHATFNGQPTRIFGSIGMMRQLRTEAEDLAQVRLADGTYAGPTFTCVA